MSKGKKKGKTPSYKDDPPWMRGYFPFHLRITAPISSQLHLHQSSLKIDDLDEDNQSSFMNELCSYKLYCCDRRMCSLSRHNYELTELPNIFPPKLRWGSGVGSGGPGGGGELEGKPTVQQTYCMTVLEINILTLHDQCCVNDWYIASITRLNHLSYIFGYSFRASNRFGCPHGPAKPTRAHRALRGYSLLVEGRSGISIGEGGLSQFGGLIDIQTYGQTVDLGDPPQYFVWPSPRPTSQRRRELNTRKNVHLRIRVRSVTRHIHSADTLGRMFLVMIGATKYGSKQKRTTPNSNSNNSNNNNNNSSSSSNSNSSSNFISNNSNNNSSNSGSTVGGSTVGGSTVARSSPAKIEAPAGRNSVSSLTKRDLLNQMVTQTQQHRKQIRTLETELGRLRTGDVLTKCEVAMGDVEWRPGDVVGEGSFSTVYKGTYCATEVAVKELKFKLFQDDKNYFRSEAALLQQLHHPRVVLLMGVCTAATRPFMVLEYLSGGTLYSLIHNTTRERLDHAAYFIVAKDIAQGLNYLHKHDPQVLHLDLKSMNVLLDPYTRAKIADFGFSILRRNRNEPQQQKGSIRGTPAWMAPELLTKGEVSVKCDVYSYAIILWEMLTAQHPFKGADIFQIMEQVESGGRPPLPSAGVSRELRELIISCWAQNPSLRPSFEEILGALEAAALPPSWRGMLNKANVPPSVMSDVTAARTIIGVVEKSAELFRKSQERAKNNKGNQKKDGPKGQQHKLSYELEETLFFAYTGLDNRRTNQRSSSHTPPTRGSSSNRSPRDSSANNSPRARDSTPVKNTRYRSPERRRDSSPEKGYRRSSPDKRPVPSENNRKSASPNRIYQGRRIDRDQRTDRDRGLDKNRDRPREESLDRRNVVRAERLPRERERSDRSKNTKEIRDRYEVRDVKRKDSRDRERLVKKKESEIEGREKKSEIERGRGASNYKVRDRTSDVRQYAAERRPKRSTSLDSRDYPRDRRAQKTSRIQEKKFNSPERQKDERYGRSYSPVCRLSGDSESNWMFQAALAIDSRDSIGESITESLSSLEETRSIRSNSSEERDSGHSSRRQERSYSVSPVRRSPERRRSPTRHLTTDYRRSPEFLGNLDVRRKSPELRRSPRSPVRRNRVRTPENRRESGMRLGPLLVTSEQLRSQKQRLRPVRPSDLSDLGHIPEDSLADISEVLKKAINKRRDAFDFMHSGRDTYRSDDFGWSE
ncbi:unnamed protein product, partial [Meganyctiphanes norvegica]